MQVVFYTRPGCCLCDDAAGELRSLAAQFGFQIDEVDITADQQAHDRWWADIPVITIGETVLRAPIDGLRLRHELLSAMRTGE